MTCTLCLLTFNEIEGCKLDIPLINASVFDDYYAIDGGSKDGTIEYLQDLGIPVIVQKKKGYNSAYIEAFENCKTEFLVFFHPKGSVSPDYLLQFPEYFKLGFDLVIAGRTIKGAINEEDKKLIKPRKWFVQFLGWFAGMIWHSEGYRVRDVLHGFRGMNVDAFKKIKALNYGLSVDLEMVIRSYKFKFKRVEFPVEEKKRPHGVTNFKAWPTGKILLKYMWYELFRKD